MSHVTHIAKQKQILDLRWNILRAIREFFWSEQFLEVETPLILRLPGQEPYLSPMRLTIHDEKNQAYDAYLHTSPEYTLKKMLAAGYTNIFSLCKTFRDYESFGGLHNPEFTMIEWYRANADFYVLMDDVEKLFDYIVKKLETARPPASSLAGEVGRGNWKLKNNSQFLISNFQRVHMRDLWQKYIGVNLDEYLTRETMFELCVKKGYTPKNDEQYEDLFYRIFLNDIEPKLKDLGGVIVHHYPLPMASLSRPSTTDIGYAERMEVYVNGMELANGFSELTDAAEQKKRLEEEQERRKAMGKDDFDIDEDFIEAVGMMPPSAGIALGIDRLVQVFGDCKNIDDVLVLPAAKLFIANGS
ncbi:MAG: EF-P lysine aminoacylase EpmA [Patescibacteria group bacterium]